MVLYIFNPGHDEALAAHTPYYTDTKAAQMLVSHLWSLPSLWAGADDCVCSQNNLRQMGIDWSKVTEIRPWGWDAALCHRLQIAGAPPHLLPTSDDLEFFRTLSSRASAVRLLEAVPHDPICRNRWCESEEDIRQCLTDYGDAVIKAPWSCSGRGVFTTKDMSAEAVWSRARNILRRQGAVEIEPYYTKIEDLALIFEADRTGRVTYLGLSRFLTAKDGGYIGNEVNAQHIGQTKVYGKDLRMLIDRYVETLQTMLMGRYCGVLGVDMMLIKNPAAEYVTHETSEQKLGTEEAALGTAEAALETAELILHPCIELNLRHTMGWVALQLSHHPKIGGRCGMMRIDASKHMGENAERLCGDADLGLFFTPEIT